MTFFFYDDNGQLLGSFTRGKLSLNMFVDKDYLAFSLFQVMTKIMAQGGGASYGGPLQGESGGDYGEP